jgi:hypothetical protein
MELTTAMQSSLELTLYSLQSKGSPTILQAECPCLFVTVSMLRIKLYQLRFTK